MKRKILYLCNYHIILMYIYYFLFPYVINHVENVCTSNSSFFVCFCILLFSFGYVQTFLKMMPGGQLAHLGTRMIEFIEDSLNDIWEINLATETLFFTGLVRITTGLGAQPTRAIVTRETIVIILRL